MNPLYFISWLYQVWERINARTKETYMSKNWLEEYHK